MILCLFLVTALFSNVGLADIFCPNGRSPGPQTIHIESNKSVSFKTQPGEMYGQNVRCKVFFKKTSACPSLVVSCPRFDVAHPRANCRPNTGDFLSLGSQRFCQNSGPSNFTSGANKLVLQFRSNRRDHGEGAECTIACSDFTPGAQPDPVTCTPEATTVAATTVPATTVPATTVPPTGTGTGTDTDWSYCSSSSPCAHKEGDCDSDAECAQDHVCGNNNCINYWNLAETDADCCIPEVKLVGGSGPHEGNIFVGGLPVCDDDHNVQNALVVCRMLGYSYGQHTMESQFGSVFDTFQMDNVQCTGNETSLLDCPHLTVDDCGSWEGAGVICSNSVSAPTTDTPVPTPATDYGQCRASATWTLDVSVESDDCRNGAEAGTSGGFTGYCCVCCTSNGDCTATTESGCTTTDSWWDGIVRKGDVTNQNFTQENEVPRV